MRLKEFVSANPHMDSTGWRQELVGGTVVTLPARPEGLQMRSLSVFGALAGCARRADGKQRIDSGSGIGVEAPEGDHFRIADVIIQLPGKMAKRFDPVLVALVVEDAAALAAEDAARLDIYRRHRTVKEVLLFSADRAVCAVHRRFGGAWSDDVVTGADATVRLGSLGVSLLLLTAYPDLAPE